MSNIRLDLDLSFRGFCLQLKPIKAPPELERLSQLADNAASSAKSGSGFWNSIGLLILEVAVADCLFDDD